MLKYKIYKKNFKEAFFDINKYYQKEWYWIVNFIYFASLISNNLHKENNINKKYLNTLFTSNFLLPDWIALQKYFQKKYKISLDNINWTDFLPYFLQNIDKKNTQIYIYGSDQETLMKCKNKIENDFGIQVFYYKNWYKKLNAKNIKIWNKKNRILLVWRWTPLQENRIYENRKYLIKKWFLTFGVGWLIWFLWGSEKRAPKIIRKIKLEWAYRFLQNPKKNRKKVYYSLYILKYIFYK